jgi:hypothetical protein
MNEHEEPKLTTRRARRLQEQLETTGIPVVTPEVAQAEATAQTDDAAEGNNDINISPVDPDGRPRTRREMRELRDAAMQDSETMGSSDGKSGRATPGEAFQVANVPTQGFDPRLAATEAMSFADLIEDSIETVGGANASEPELTNETELVDEAVLVVEAEQLVETEEAAEAPAKGRFRMPWNRSKDVVEENELEIDALVEDASVEDASDVSAVDADPVNEDAPEEVAPPGEHESTELTSQPEDHAGISDHEWAMSVANQPKDVAPRTDTVSPGAMPATPASAMLNPTPETVSTTGDDDGTEDGETADAPAPASARTNYSFPDIVPLEEGRSVFDDPSTQAMLALPTHDLVPSQTERTGDFDELISRVVAAEGATSVTTSALILPSMPAGTDLTGALGETGELFITGSIELPRSLGETGGHARLHDSVEFDPLMDLGIDLNHESAPDDSAPMSATRAISARMVEGSGVIAPHTKRGNRLPLVLSITAGGLLLGFIGLLAWGASNGMFQ